LSALRLAVAETIPTPIKVYDETIRVLKSAVQGAKLGDDESVATDKASP
jgi:hypothetical protein